MLRKCSIDDEDAFACAHTSLSPIGVLMVCTAAICFAIAMVDGIQGPDIGDDNWDNATRWQLTHYFTVENGSRFYMYNSDETGKLELREVGWGFDNFRIGMMRIYYGTSWECFCWPRNETEVIPEYISLFRAMQVRATCQLLIRATVLGTMTFRIIVTFFVAISRHVLEPSFKTRFVGGITCLLAVAECVVAFLITDLQHYQDQKIIFLLLPSVYLFFAITPLRVVLTQFFLNKQHEMLPWPSILVLMASGIIPLCAPPILQDVKDYLARPTCDIYVESPVTIAYVALVIALFVIGYYEACALAHFRIQIVPLLAEFDFDRTKMQVYTPVWREYHQSGRCFY